MPDISVVVLGASDNEERYSYKALTILKSKNYRVIPVHPTLESIEGIPVVKELSQIREKVHTVTVYIGPGRITSMIDDIVKLKPLRVILNPGTESDELKKALDKASIKYLEACTIILAKSGQFDKAGL